MKKIAIIIAAILALLGCQKPTPEPIAKEVQISLSYSIDTPKGNDMTKITDEDIFDIFYQKMKTGELVAPSYELTFTEVNTKETYVFNGKWANKSLITMKTGKYNVTGKSKAEGEYIQELASLKFDEEIEITASTSAITLQAIYDCFLLIFVKSDIIVMENYYWQGNRVPLFVLSDYYYAYANDKLHSDSITQAMKDYIYIIGKRSDGTTFKIMTVGAGFEKGKYYVYNDLGGSFNLPEMETSYNLPSMESGK